MSDWAGAFVRAYVDVEDEAVWDALLYLAGADLQTGPNTYLHGPNTWVSEFIPAAP